MRSYKSVFCATLLFLAAALTSCQKDGADPYEAKDGRVPESIPSNYVRFIPSISGLEMEEGTKSILGNDIESKCSGYQVLVFDKTAGVFEGVHPYPSASITSTEGIALDRDHAYDFYMIGNLWFLDSGGNRKSYADLFSATGNSLQTSADMLDPSKFPYYMLDGKAVGSTGLRTETFAECANYGIPFAGVAKDVSASSLDSNGQFDITVTRLFAKETVLIDHYGLDGGLGANIFKNGTLYLRQVNCRLHPFITGVCAQSTDDILAETDYYATMSNDQASKFILYVPENVQGTASGTAAQKIPANAPSGKSGLVTYVEFKGVVDKAAGGYGGNIQYQYCLGSDAASDYNVVRNTDYGVTLGFEAGSLFSPYWKVSCTDTEGMPLDSRKLGLCKDPDGSQMLAENNQPIVINRLNSSWFDFYVYFNKDGNSGINQYKKHIDAYTAGYTPGNVTRSAVDVQLPTIPGIDWAFDSTAGKISFKVSDPSQFVEGKEYDLTVTLYAISGLAISTYTAKITTQVDEYYVTDVSVAQTEFTAAGGTTTITGGKVMKRVTDNYGNPLPDQDMGDATFTLSPHSNLPSVTGSISGRTVTIPNLQKNETSAGTYTLTASYGGIEKTFIIKQGANEKTYLVPDVSLTYTPESISAAGGESNPAVSYTQKIVYTSGAEDSVNTGGTVTYSGSSAGFTLGTDGKVTAEANTGVTRSIVVTASVALNGKTGTKTATISQSADSIVGYSEPVITISYDPASIGAAGGTATPTIAYSQTVTYASGRTETVTSGGSVSYSGSATGFTLGTDGKVTASANEGTERSITVEASVTVNGKTSTKTVTVTQDGDSITGYSDPAVTVSYSPSSIGAAGGTATPTVSYSQTVNYASGKTETITSGATPTYNGSATGFTLGADGKVTAAENTGTARSITVTASVTLNGKTGSGSATIEQAGDSITGYSDPAVTFSYSPSSVGAAGGTATPAVTYSQTAYYASGRTETITSGGSVSYSGSAAGFSLGTDGKVTAAANTGTARNITVTATVSLNGKSGSNTATVSQDADSITGYSVPELTFSYSPSTVGAAGGTATPSLSYSQTVNYASGKTETITSGATPSYSGSAAGFSLGTDGKVTASANEGTARSISVTASVTLNGKTGTKSATVNQSGDSITGYTDPVVTFSYSPASHTAAGGTSTPTVTYSQTANYASGKTETITTGGSVSYSGSATGFTLGTDGKVTAAANEGTARSITVTASVALNGKTGTATATVSQDADSVSGYSDLTATFSYTPSQLEYTGGTATPALSYSQTASYVSGRTQTLTSGATVAYSGSATGFTLGTDGKVTAAANSSEPRSITVTVDVTLNGKSVQKTASVMQKADFEIIIE